MTEGTDVNKLYGSSNKTVEIEYKGETWTFVLRTPLMGEMERYTSKLMKMGQDGSLIMDTEAYYMEIIPELLVKAPPGFDIRKVSYEFGGLLKQHIPTPGQFQTIDDVDIDARKNSDGESEETQ